MSTVAGAHAAPGRASPTPPKPPTFTACNELNTKVVIKAEDESRFVLPPLGERKVTEDEITRYTLRRWNEEIRIEKEPEAGARTKVSFFAITLGFWFAIVWESSASS